MWSSLSGTNRLVSELGTEAFVIGTAVGDHAILQITPSARAR